MRAMTVVTLSMVAALGCGKSRMMPDPDAGPIDLGDGGVKCTAELEALMTAAMANAPATESFVFELRRDSDGRVFRTARTVSGKAPVTEGTMLQSASTAKWISAVVILDVVANPSAYPGPGGLTLDTLVRDVVPSWRPPTSNSLSSVTLRQLLSFTSGLEREHACVTSMTDPDVCVGNLVDANLAGNADATAPRTFFYNGAHLFVAARAAVLASGMGDWGALFKRFKERHQVFLTPLDSPGPTSFGVGAFFPFSGPGNSPSPAGAMRFTAGDYTPFLVKLMHGEILPAAVVTQLFTDEVARQNVSIEYSPLLDDGEAWHYNLGNWTECPSATFLPTCTTARRYSSPGSFGTYPFVDFNPSTAGDAPFVGIIGYGGTTQGVAATTIALYRTLGGGQPGQRDLAQQWAAATCP